MGLESNSKEIGTKMQQINKQTQKSISAVMHVHNRLNISQPLPQVKIVQFQNNISKHIKSQTIF